MASPHLPIVLDAQLLELLPAAVYVCDLDGVVVRYNQRAAELWGRWPIPGDANELYCGSYRLYLPNGALMPHNQTPMVEAMRSGKSFRNLDVQIEQPNGKRIWAIVSIDPLRDERGKIIGAINCFQDVTEHRLAQQRKLQLDELNHRMKNLMATVQSIASFTFRNADGKEAVAIFSDRLLALARAHEVLALEKWDGANLRDVVREVAVPFCSGRLDIAGPEVQIDARLSVSLALALQELATNALKYGALSRPEGSVTLSWNMSDEDGSRRLNLHWIETTSFAVQPPVHRGFGTSLVERMLAQFHGAQVTLPYPPEGARCEIVVPL